MQRSNRELWLSFIAIIGITIAYIFVVSMQNAIPPASDFFGHTIGIFGFILMVMTETLYSMRKRSRKASWGKMSEWLNFHIFTGVVGPYMVLLHTSWKFNGLAGIVMLLTVIIVASGFIGRYIYTAVPRTVDGVEIETSVIEEQILTVDAELKKWLSARPEISHAYSRRLATQPATSSSQLMLILGRSFSDWGYRIQWWLDKGKLDSKARAQANQLEKLLKRQRQLRRQVNSLAMARQMLALWHAIHIPIGMVLFTAATVHIIAAIYYASLLR